MNKLDFSKPEELQTRDGRQVRIYATDGAVGYPVHGAIRRDKDSEWVLAEWTIDGRNCNSVVTSVNDLVRKPARVKGWVNGYEQLFGCLAPSLGDVAYTTQQLARENVSGRGKCFGQIYIDAEILIGSTKPLNVHIPVTELEEPMIEPVLAKANRVESDSREDELRMGRERQANRCRS